MKRRVLIVLVITLILAFCFIGCNGGGCGCGVTLPVDIEEENVTIKRIGDTVQLNVVGGNADDRVWSSANVEIATVTETGLVTAVANGIAEITVTSAGKTDTCVIVVKEEILPEVGLSVTFPKTAVSINATYEETYTITPSVTKDGEIVQATLEWSSSDESKATVEGGVVKAIANTAKGVPVEIKCKATYEGEWAEAILYVTVEDDTDIVFLTSVTKFYTTDAEIALPVIAKINGVVSSEQAVYSTSDIGVAKVEDNKILPVGPGFVTVYATVNGKTKGIEIEVKTKLFIDSVEVGS